MTSATPWILGRATETLSDATKRQAAASVTDLAQPSSGFKRKASEIETGQPTHEVALLCDSKTVMTPTAKKASKARAAEKAHLKQCNSFFVFENWRNNRDSSTPRGQPAVTGAERLAALRRRVRGQ